MRRVLFATLFATAACQGDTEVIPVDVQWMDWPAEVVAGVPFRTRLVVFGPCAITKAFRPSPHADPSAVTFRPYFIAENQDIVCIARGGVSEVLLVSALDTAGMAPGLSAESPRTYEMRAASASNLLVAGRTIRTFGDVAVFPPSGPGPALPEPPRNAAGHVSKEVDVSGCVRIRPVGLYSPGAALVLENPSDTAGLQWAFVRGYVYTPATPVCGESRVFHLVSRN